MRVSWLSELYTLLALFFTAFLLPPPLSLIALALAALRLSSLILGKPCLTYLALLALLPLLLEAYFNSPLLATVLSLPTMPSIGHELRDRMLIKWAQPQPSPALSQLLPAACVIALLALFLKLSSTALTSSIFIAGLLAFSLRRKSSLQRCLEVRAPDLRVVHGSSLTVELEVINKLGEEVFVRVLPLNAWSSISPIRAVLRPRSKARAYLTVKPPLSAPLVVEGEVLVFDCLGLTCLKKNLQLARLEVIPRARLAKWLASKVIEGGGLASVYSTATTVFLRRFLVRSRDEYLGSRPFLPGDRVRDVDWKSTLRRWQVMVKDYKGLGIESVIILGSLTAPSLEDLDLLLYELFSQCLAAMFEETPTVLVLYDDEGVVVATEPQPPLQALKSLYEVFDRAYVAKEIRRLLPAQPPCLPRFHLLERLVELRSLSIDYHAKRHPVGKAVAEALSKQPPPALLVLTTASPDDLELASRMLISARERGYRVLENLVSSKGAGPTTIK